ncbi:hypothetical protein [Thalassoroseus pseudoceratinae]|uniref:hypothetical protein n=1 Tax=Thalassoroseus pseudoceratinae TaxID=2713176 RepID=UPI00141FF482|nr:hypothetical protein [Thalassoroseus pseudoceratinae]
MSLPPIGLIGPAMLAGQVAGGAAVALGRGFGQLLQSATASQAKTESSPTNTATAADLLPAGQSLSQNFLRGELRSFASQLQERLASLFRSSDEFQLRVDSNGQTEFSGTQKSQALWDQAFGADGSLQDLVAEISDRLNQLGPKSALTVTPSRIGLDRNSA